MDFFAFALLRLKEQLKVQSDKEVAALLGMSPTAFADRKKRGAFPEDKLFALQARNPELGVDVAYVLTGTPARVHSVMGSVQTAKELSERMGGTHEEKSERLGAMASALLKELPALTEAEALLLSRYRASPQALRDAALRVLLGGDPPPSGQAQFNIGANHGQVIEGGQVNHGPISFGTGKAPPKKK